MQEVRVLGKALSGGQGKNCPTTLDTKGSKDQVHCVCECVSECVCGGGCVCALYKTLRGQSLYVRKHMGRLIVNVLIPRMHCCNSDNNEHLYLGNLSPLAAVLLLTFDPSIP